MPNPRPAGGLGRAPAEGFGGGFKHGAEAGVLGVGQVLEAEFQRVHFQQARQFVHVDFAGEIVGGGGQGAIGSLGQRGAGVASDGGLIGNGKGC